MGCVNIMFSIDLYFLNNEENSDFIDSRTEIRLRVLPVNCESMLDD